MSQQLVNDVIDSALVPVESLFITLTQPVSQKQYSGWMEISGFIDKTDTETDLSSCILTLSIAGLDKQMAIPVSRLMKEPSENSTIDFKLELNSFLLDQGQYTLIVELLQPEQASLPMDSLSCVFHVHREGVLAEETHEALKNYKASPLFYRFGTIDSSCFPLEQPKPWFDQPEARLRIQEIVSKHGLPSSFYFYLTQFIEKGFCTLDSFIPPLLIEQANAALNSHMIATGESVESPYPQSNLDCCGEPWQAIFRYQPLLDILMILMEEKPILSAMTAFVRGGFHGAYQDNLYYSSYPHSRMLGVWVALENIEPDSGPPYFFIKSHRLPVNTMQVLGQRKVRSYSWNPIVPGYSEALGKQIEVQKCRIQAATPRVGGIIIYHGNVIHGDMAMKNAKATRKSLMLNYYSQGAVAYNDSNGFSRPLFD